MKSVYCLNPISNAGMSRFDDTYCIADSIENADAVDRKSTRLNSSHSDRSRMPSSA